MIDSNVGDLRKSTVISSGEGVVDGLGSRYSGVVVCWMLIGGWQSRSVSAIGVDEDGVALDELAVDTSERLLRADVARRFGPLAAIERGTLLVPFCQTSTVSRERDC